MMERIAPLAKILAEANGIEWQQLKGTGAGGMVVEQDILDYLSRVMSGEAEPPSTPVDAPPPDWNGEDLPGGGMFDAQMLSKAGVESDIADFVQQSRPATPAPSGVLSQDDFELDDAEEDSLLAPAAPAPAPSPFDIPPVAPAATFSSGPIPTGAIPVSSGPVNRIPESPVASSPVPESPAAPAPSAPKSPAGGLGSLLSRLYQKDSDAPAAPSPTGTESRPSSFTSGGPGSTESGSFGRSGSSSFGVGSSPAGRTGSLGAGGFSSESLVPPVPTSPFNVPPVELRDVELRDVELRDQAPLADAPSPVTPALVSPMTAPLAAQVPMTAQVDVNEATPEQTTLGQTNPEQDVPAATTQDRVQDTVLAAPSPEEEEAVADVQPSEPVLESAPAAAPAAPRDAVWFGTYLRRDAGVAPLHDLRSQLSEALEREVPLALLVARAAQRHAAALGLGSVALRDMDRGLTRQMGGEVGSSVSLRDALQATDQNFDGTPDLLVVDAGALDMDDLHYPETLTLSVGRVQEGRAALSLQGDVDPEKAARFLASVAQTLEKPIILLV